MIYFLDNLFSSLNLFVLPYNIVKQTYLNSKQKSLLTNELNLYHGPGESSILIVWRGVHYFSITCTAMTCDVCNISSLISNVCAKTCHLPFVYRHTKSSVS